MGPEIGPDDVSTKWLNNRKGGDELKNNEGHIVFTISQKEVRLLPEKYKKIFRACGFKFTAVRRENTGVWEIRKQIEHIKIYASSKDLNEAKRKFVEKIRSLSDLSVVSEHHEDFCGYVLQFIETVKKPAVKEITFRSYMQAFRLYIAPQFSGKKLDEITRQDCQNYFNVFLESGHYRTAQIVHQLMSAVFIYALQDGLIKKSPMTLVKLPPMEREHGSALTLDEEMELVKKCMEKIEQPTMQAVLFVLYTGIRRSELASAIIDDNFINVANAKLRKGRKQTVRYIPITPKLRAVLPYISLQAFSVSPDMLTRTVKKLMPEHHSHELRHTFISRCKECGVLPEVVSIWAGHALSGTVTVTVYTHYSKEFMLSEAEKVRY